MRWCLLTVIFLSGPAFASESVPGNFELACASIVVVRQSGKTSAHDGPAVALSKTSGKQFGLAIAQLNGSLGLNVITNREGELEIAIFEITPDGSGRKSSASSRVEDGLTFNFGNQGSLRASDSSCRVALWRVACAPTEAVARKKVATATFGDVGSDPVPDDCVFDSNLP